MQYGFNRTVDHLESICDVGNDERELFALLERAYVAQGSGREIIETHHVSSAGDERLAEMRADEPSPSRDHDAWGVGSSVLSPGGQALGPAGDQGRPIPT